MLENVRPDPENDASEIKLAFVASVAAAAAAFWLFHGLRQDDAYIAMQYARNVATGHGFVFNQGDRVFGATSPLHVLLLAGVYAIFGNVLEPAAILIGAAAVGAQAFLLFLLFRRTNTLLAWLLLGVTVSGLMGSYSYLALETNLLAALVLAAILCLEDGRELLCGVFVGLAFLCRYDAVLLVPICVATWWWRTRVIPKRMLAAALIVVAPWLTWAFWYFNAFLPQTFWAKRGVSEPFGFLRATMTEFAKAPWAMLPNRVARVFALTTPLFWLSGAFLLWRRAKQVLPLLIFGGILEIAYCLIGPPQTQFWHLYLAQMSATLAFVAGLAGWFAFEEFWKRPMLAVRKPLLTAMATFVLLTGTQGTVLFARSYPTDFWWGHRYGRYVEVSTWLRQNVASGHAVLPFEVGTIGYLSGFRMVDPFGLINKIGQFDDQIEHVDASDGWLAGVAKLAEWYHPDVLLVNSPDDGAFFEARSSFRMVKVFEWNPWSTLLVRSPDVLIDPASFDRLRAELPEQAHAIANGNLITTDAAPLR